jgi:hypothetical protein
MLTSKRTIMLLIFLCGSLLAATVTPRSQNPNDHNAPRQPNKKRNQVDVSKWPATDYDSSDTVDERSKRIRETRGKNFNKSRFEVNPASVSDNYVLTHSDTDLLPALPKLQSDVVVVGDVVDARAYLSNDKTGVYSEFGVLVTEIIKNFAEQPLSANDSIKVLREGGRVRLPSGRVQLYSISKENMPEAQQQYVFFLRHLDEGQGFKLLTGYALKNGKVFPLDEQSQFDAFKGADETEFLNKVRESR